MSKKTPSILVAVAGQPNSGKSTVFNMLTGARQFVANYPGVTVEKKNGNIPLSRQQGGVSRPSGNLQPHLLQPGGAHGQRFSSPGESRPGTQHRGCLQPGAKSVPNATAPGDEYSPGYRPEHDGRCWKTGLSAIS